MRTRTLICGAVAVLLLVGVPTMAQEFEDEKRGWCSPAGTWQGMNFTENLPFIITIDRIGWSRYSSVAESLTQPGAIDQTSWRGEYVRTGPMTGVIRQLILYRWPDPDPVANPDGNVLLGAVEGDVVFTSCDHFDIDYHTLGLYYWRPGIVPFVDPFDIPYTPPGPPGHAEYDRMPMP